MFQPNIPFGDENDSKNDQKHSSDSKGTLNSLQESYMTLKEKVSFKNLDPRIKMVSSPSQKIKAALAQHMARELLVSQFWEIQEAVGLVVQLIKEQKNDSIQSSGAEQQEDGQQNFANSFVLPKNRKELVLYIETEVLLCTSGVLPFPRNSLRKWVSRLIKPPKRQKPRNVPLSVLQRSLGEHQEAADFVKMDIFHQQTAWGNGLGLEKHLFKQKGIKFIAGVLFVDFLQPPAGGEEKASRTQNTSVPIFLQVPYRVDGKYWKQEQTRLPSVGSSEELLDLPSPPKKIYVMCRTRERSDQLELRELCSGFLGSQDLFYVKNPEAREPEKTFELVERGLICERTKMYPVLSAPKMNRSCTLVVEKLESYARASEEGQDTEPWKYTPDYEQENLKLQNFADGMYSLLFFLAFFDVFGPALNEEKSAAKTQKADRLLEVALFFIGDVTVEARASKAAFDTGNTKKRKKRNKNSEQNLEEKKLTEPPTKNNDPKVKEEEVPEKNSEDPQTQQDPTKRITVQNILRSNKIRDRQRFSASRTSMILVCETLIASIETVTNLGKKMFRKNLNLHMQEHQLMRVFRLLKIAKLVVGKPSSCRKNELPENDKNPEKKDQGQGSIRVDCLPIQLLKQNFAHTFFGPPRFPSTENETDPCDFQIKDLDSLERGNIKKKITDLYQLWKQVCASLTDLNQPLSNPETASQIEETFISLIKDAEKPNTPQKEEGTKWIVTKTLEQAMQNFRNRCVTYGCILPKHPYKKQDVVMYCQRCKNYFQNLDMGNMFEKKKTDIVSDHSDHSEQQKKKSTKKKNTKKKKSKK